jgi:hypothetical protein
LNERRGSFNAAQDRFNDISPMDVTGAGAPVHAMMRTGYTEALGKEATAPPTPAAEDMPIR